MHDKELIKKVCDLTCSREDVIRNQTTIKYDNEFPFKKYYDGNIIVAALKKYISHEWDDKMISHWACIYCWILSGGFDYNLKEDLNSLENFFKDVITWDLDGIAFFDDDIYENGIDEMKDWIEQHINFDHVWKTINEWKAVYAMVGKNAEFNRDQYVVLINDKLREYMIIHSDHLENGFNDEYFKYVSEDEFVNLIEELKEKNYKILSYSEKWYYSEINNED